MRRRRRHKKTRLSPVRAARPLPVKLSSLRPYDRLLLAEQMRDPVRVARTEVRRSAPLTDVEDLRLHDPSTRGDLRSPTYRTESGKRAEYGYIPVRDRFYLPGRPQDNLRFFDPQNTVACIRRRARRRVLFALRRTGRRGLHNRRAHWTDKSFIQCR